MTRSVPAVLAFNAGELNPTLHARADLTRYASGCKTLLNMLVLAEGPATRRPGTRFVARTRGDAVARLIAFEFSTVQAYVIEVTAGWFRFYRDGGQIEVTPGVPYEIANPYSEADLPLLRWVQSADVLYLVHPQHEPRKLTRTGHTAWTLTTISFTSPPSVWGSGNWPSVVAFFEERLIFAATPNEPQTVWASKTGDFENMTTGSAADDGLSFSILDGQVNAIRWLAPLRALMAGTPAAEFAISGDNNESLRPTSVQARRQTTTGSAAVAALTVGFAALHVGRSARTLWEIGYDFTRDGYISAELSALARHVLRPGVVETAWHQDPWRTVWAVLGDGTMAGLTYMRDQDVVAWHRHRLGGPAAKVLSAAVIASGAEGQLWLCVERDYAGHVRRFVEVMTPEFAPVGTDARDAFFVDCGLTYSGPATASIGGLQHLAGRTVAVLVDGATHPDVVVSGGGAITLQQPGELVHVGFSYVSEVEPLDIQAAVPDGASLTRTKRVAYVGLLLHQTVGGLVGWRDARSGAVEFEAIETRVGTDPMDTAVPLFTGTLRVQVPSRWARDASVVVRQDQPLPLTVLGIVPRTQTND
jgi:hypothetical protein